MHADPSVCCDGPRLFHDGRELRANDPQAFEYSGIATLLFVEGSYDRALFIAEQWMIIRTGDMAACELTRRAYIDHRQFGCDEIVDRKVSQHGGKIGVRAHFSTFARMIRSSQRATEKRF